MLEHKYKARLASSLITKFGGFVKPHSSAQVLDLACGSGRNGLWFAKQGYSVTFLDRDLTSLSEEVKTLEANAELMQFDLEDGSAPELPKAQFDIILVFNYLHRPLFPQIKQALKPGGLVIYETFIEKQAEIGRPRNPKFLLKYGELKLVFSDWDCLHFRQGEFGEESSVCFKAQMIARKP